MSLRSVLPKSSATRGGIRSCTFRSLLHLGESFLRGSAKAQAVS